MDEEVQPMRKERKKHDWYQVSTYLFSFEDKTTQNKFPIALAHLDAPQSAKGPSLKISLENTYLPTKPRVTLAEQFYLQMHRYNKLLDTILIRSSSQVKD